ncbi:hypothetical protein F444_18469 [Phytophthora nicotianae P1976]|uniref:Uncharacterized protein n=1 Tax=Phytophthora nicotianae P1976 TaxID=1317066 RepID=A0A080ZB87_PHYNI|nr:hypothetical protein F444_18469 [Phytophthora nicotianae P1976]
MAAKNCMAMTDRTLTLFYEAKKDGNKVIELTSRRCAWAPSRAS